MFLWPFLAVVFMLGLITVQKHSADALVPPPSASYALRDANDFVNYKNAVLNYVQTNPTFTGTVDANSLSAFATFSPTFLSNVSNRVTPTGTKGRVITTYGNLFAGTISYVSQLTDGDLSIGIAGGGNWTSYANSASAVTSPLPVSVPDGDIVSVIQIGV